jgi:hypothetical protein
VMGTTEKEVADGEGGIRCFIAVSSGKGRPCPDPGARSRMYAVFGGLRTGRPISIGGCNLMLGTRGLCQTEKLVWIC